MHSDSHFSNCNPMSAPRSKFDSNSSILTSHGRQVCIMKGLCIAVLFTVIAPPTTPAQAPNVKETAGSQIVESIVIRGNRRITDSEIKACLSTRKRSVYQPQKLDRDVRALYATGHFEDVRVYVEPGLHGGKIVTFEAFDRPLIFDIGYEGIESTQQEEVQQEWSRQKVDVSKGAEYNPATIKLAGKILQELITKKKNQSVRVIPMVERLTATDVSVNFIVESGSQ